MDFRNFQSLFIGREFFTRAEIELRAPWIRVQNLTDWHQKGWIRNIIKWVWDFGKKYQQEKYLWAASLFIEKHSYISLESALRHWDLIPEEVAIITCVTTSKSKSFITSIGRFRFQKISARAFVWYTQHKIGNHVYQIATPEKAIVDFLWLHPAIASHEDHEEMRWTESSLSTLDVSLIRSYALLYAKKPFLARIETFIHCIPF